MSTLPPEADIDASRFFRMECPDVAAAYFCLHDCDGHRVKSQLRAGPLAQRRQDTQPSRRDQGGGYVESRRQGRRGVKRKARGGVTGMRSCGRPAPCGRDLRIADKYLEGRLVGAPALEPETR